MKGIDKRRKGNAMRSIILMLWLCLPFLNSFAQMYISPNATVFISPNTIFTINTDLTIGTNAVLTQNGFGTIYISGSWTNNGTFNPNTGLVIFNSSGNATINGSSSTNFYVLHINKTGSSVVTLERDVTVNDSLLVQNGVLRFGNSQFVKMIVNGNVFIASSGIFDVVNSLPSAGDSLKISGNLTVEGSIDFNLSNGKVFTFFINSGNANIDGSGTISLYELIMDKPSRSDTVHLKRSITVPNGFLTLNGGIFKVEGSYTFTNTFFKPYSSNIFIQKNAGLYLDNPNVTVNGQSTAGDLYLRGSLYLNQGVMNVGTTGESSIIYDNTSPDVSELVVNNATLNIRTRLSPSTYGTNLINYTQTNGLVRIGAGSQSTVNNVGMFDISATASSFNWSGGTIELNSPATNTVADYVVLATNGTVSGGLLKVDAIASGYTFELNTTMPVYEFQMTGTNNPIVRLLDNDLTVLTNMTFAGNGNGLFNTNNLNITIGGNWINNFASMNGFDPTTSTVTFNGATTQNISGTQSTRFNNLTINKSAGDIELNMPATVENNLRLISSTIFDLNSNDLTIGESGNIYSDNGTQDGLSTFNSNKCLINSGSGSDPLAGAKLIRRISSSASLPLSLKYPIGTPNAYSPAEIIFNSGGASFGTNAYVSVKPVPLEHPEVIVSNKSLTKYWVVADTNITYSNDGATVRFYYNQIEVQGIENDYIVLYFSPSYNNPNGYWRSNPGVNNYVDYTNNLFYSQQVDSIAGDWTVGNISAIRRIFFSRQSGSWSSDQSWTYSPTHSGPIAGSGIYPNGAYDSVVVGGGNNGTGNHEITLDISNPFSSTTGVGIAVGTGATNTGTLVFGTNILNGQYFTLGDYSTIKIGSPDGITDVGTNLGNIQTTTTRGYNTNAIYIYNGSSNQTIGNGLPTTVYSFVVDNSGASPNNAVTIDKNITVQKDLRILNGTLDLQSYSMNSVVLGTGTFEMANNTMLRVGGTNDLAAVINNYQNYSIATSSIVHFNGSNQTISNLPINLSQDFLNNTGGLGNVWLSNSGTKIVSQPLLIRGNLMTFSGITLQNNTGVDALSVRGNVVNNATIYNQGVIEIGICP